MLFVYLLAILRVNKLKNLEKALDWRK